MGRQWTLTADPTVLYPRKCLLLTVRKLPIRGEEEASELCNQSCVSKACLLPSLASLQIGRLLKQDKACLGAL